MEKDGSVTVSGGEGAGNYQAKHVILAVGSKPALVPIPGLDSEGVLTSDELFQLQEVPKSLSIIGGGVIGVEFASIFAALGTKVTILEALPSILANMDKDISQNLKLILKKRGIDIHTSVKVEKVEKEAEGVSCFYTEKDEPVKVTSQYVLCAVGLCPIPRDSSEKGLSWKWREAE